MKTGSLRSSKQPWGVWSPNPANKECFCLIQRREGVVGYTVDHCSQLPWLPHHDRKQTWRFSVCPCLRQCSILMGFDAVCTTHFDAIPLHKMDYTNGWYHQFGRILSHATDRCWTTVRQGIGWNSKSMSAVAARSDQPVGLSLISSVTAAFSDHVLNQSFTIRAMSFGDEIKTHWVPFLQKSATWQ